NTYFGTLAGADQRTPAQKRYGIRPQHTGYHWEDFDERFDYVKEPNESNRFGWIVEIDPFDPSSTPRKHTALGRFKHENAALVIAPDQRVVVYMGDDQANDYIYKFVSAGRYDPNNRAANLQLLESGQLFVARFHDGATQGDMLGHGEWVLLDLKTPT